jgi:hypothetical protein
VTRSAWALCVVSVALAVAGLVLAAVNSESPAELVATHHAIGIATAVSFPVLGALILARYPRNWLGWVMIVLGVFLGLFDVSQQYAPLALGLSHRQASLPGGALASWLGAWTNMPGIGLSSYFLVLLFPDGRLASRRWQPLAWACIAATVIPTILLAVLSWPLRGPALAGPDRGPYRSLDRVFGIGLGLVVPLLVPCVVSLVLRYRRATGAQRQQIKWFTYAMILVVPLNAVPEQPGYGPVLELLTVPVWLAGIGIGIFRHRLWDIDRLINRTLVYGLLTAILGGSYALSVLVLGQAVSAGRRPSSLVVAVTTLVVAALAQPLRRWLQRAVDRRFNRRHYDAARTIEAFAARLREHTDLDVLAAELLAVVDRSLQPTQVSLWLRPSVGASPDKHGTGASGAVSQPKAASPSARTAL